MEMSNSRPVEDIELDTETNDPFDGAIDTVIEIMRDMNKTNPSLKIGVVLTLLMNTSRNPIESLGILEMVKQELHGIVNDHSRRTFTENVLSYIG